METWREIVDKLRDEPCEDGWFQLLADRIEAACKTMEDIIIVEQEENEKLRRALEPVMKCDCNPSTPTPWFVSDGEIRGKAEYSTQFPDEDGETVFEYCDTETVCQCFYNERCGTNPANKCLWIDDENSKPMAESNERAVVNAVNAVRDAQAIMRTEDEEQKTKEVSMTLRMPPWEAERLAWAMETYAALDDDIKFWAKACAARIKAAVKAERERRKKKRILH